MPFLSETGSIGDRVDGVFLFTFALSVAFLILITALMVWFVIRYNHKRHPLGEDIEGNTWLEVTWTVVPLILFLMMFYYGWTTFDYMRNPPRDAMVIEVTGRQWAWSFKYPNGRQTGELYVALGRPVKVELRSADVIHGFYIPAFRVKSDVVPGKVNFVWFSPPLLGSFDIECTVICGVNHSYMLSKVHVMSEDDFKAWYFKDEAAPAAAGKPRAADAPARTIPAGADPGLAVLIAKDCLACHSLDGAAKVGPTYKGLFGRKQVEIADGREQEIVADEPYLRRSIREPGAEIVKGYPRAMPHTSLTDEQIAAIIAYIRTLGGSGR